MAAGVAVFTGLLVAAPVVPPAGASPGLAASSVRAGHAGSHKHKGGEDITDRLQKMVLHFAEQKVAGWALSQLGLSSLLADPTETKLDQLQSDIKDISKQQVVLQDSVNSISKDTSKILLDQKEDRLTDIAGKVDTLYTLFYIPALNALQKYVQLSAAATTDGKDCLAVTDCKAARILYLGNLDLHESGDPVIGLRKEFLNQFTADGAASFGRELHDFLMPGATGDSAMSAYGLFLARTGDGSLTSADSAKVQNYYNYWADFRALAMWMLGQWAAATDPDTRFVTVTDEIGQYDKAEHEALPPPIPANTVIYLGADRTNNTTKMLMWRAPSNSLAISWIPYDPITPGGSVARELRVMNTAGDFTDWRVPTRAELDSLLKMGPANQTAADFILSLKPDWPQAFKLSLDRVNEPYMWTDQPAGIPPWKGSPAIACVNNGVTVASLTGYLHTAVGPLANSLRNFPSQFQNYSRPDPGMTKISVSLKPGSTQQEIIDACLAILKTNVLDRWDSNPDGFFATLLATRNTGDVSFLPYHP